MVEGARLEIVCTPKGYQGFESLSVRHFDLKDAGLQRLFSYPAEMRALRVVDFAKMTMVSSFYVGKCKVLGSYIRCQSANRTGRACRY